MKRLLPLLTILIGIFFFRGNIGEVYAQQLSPQQAKQRIPAAQLRLSYQSDCLYAFDSPKGFYLTSSQEVIPDILGYSEECDFNTARRNPTFDALIRQMEKNLRNRRNTITIVPHVKPGNVKAEVAPLLHNLYHQYKPFNNYCPIIDGDTCVTGCVANAMAEVMNYWNWPQRGTGSHTYEDSLGCKQTLTANFSEHEYDWDYILDDYEGNYTQRQANAVAFLLRDCGISVNMRYGVEASGASVVRQPIALVNYFGYDENLQMLYRNFYKQAEWDSIMFTELSEGRPLIVSGWSSQLAHSFTCDGYDKDGLFHCNFGNPDGDGNAWLNFTFLSPDQPKWHDINSPEQGFNLLQTILVGLHPKYNDTPSPQQYIYAFSHISTLSTQPVETLLNEPIQIVIHNLANIGWNEHSGKVGIALLPYAQEASTLNTPLLYTYHRTFQLEELVDTSYTDTLSVQLPQGIETGTYRIVPVYEQGGTFVEARTMVGTPNYLLCEVAGVKAKISTPEKATAHLVVDSFFFPDSVELTQKPHFTASFRNDGAEYSGRVFYMFVPKGSSNPDPLSGIVFAQEGLSIASGATAEREYLRTPVWRMGAGEYTIRILADVDLFTDSVNVLYDNPDHIIHVLPVGASGISSAPHSTEEVKENYDLSGRRISSPKQQKIFIRNRKKLLLP